MDTDRSYIAAWQRGNIKAYESLVIRYQKRLIGVAFQMLGNWEDAREAAQDSFVKAYQAVGDFDASKTFSTWLYRILINTCIDYRRRRNSVRDAIGIAPFQLGYLEPKTPEEDALESDDCRIVRNAMETLSPRHRAVVTLRDLEGLSSREVSQIMDCSEATVRVHLFNARRKLRKALRPMKLGMI